jgi:hypothetical protein
MTSFTSAIRRIAFIWRPILLGSILLAYNVWLVEERADPTAPYMTDPRLSAALLTPGDFGPDWQRKRVRGSAEGEITACAEFRLFSEHELLDAARIELGQDIDGEDPRWLIQTVLIANSKALAESRVRNADAVAQCSVKESDDRPTLLVERFDVPGASDVAAVRYHETEPEEPFDRPYVGHDLIIRSGRVVVTVFLGRFDQAPTMDETVALVERVQERLAAYEQAMTTEWQAIPTAAVPTGTLPRSDLDNMLPNAEDVEPLLSLIDSGVFGTEGWAFDHLLPSSQGFIVGEYRQFRSVGDFYEYVGSCAAFNTSTAASQAVQRARQGFLTVDNNPYAVESVDGDTYGDESELLTGTVVRSEINYPVAIVLVRDDEVTCQFLGFSVDDDPLQPVMDLVERVLVPRED